MLSAIKNVSTALAVAINIVPQVGNAQSILDLSKKPCRDVAYKVSIGVQPKIDCGITNSDFV